MPRIYTGSNDAIDFCWMCFPGPRAAWDEFGPGEGPDNRGNCFEYDADHPPYADTGYRCHRCGERLGDHDDIAMEGDGR